MQGSWSSQSSGVPPRQTWLRQVSEPLHRLLSLQSGSLAVTGQAPLAELEGYAARIKSMTGGLGAWSMELSHYEPAPPSLQQQLAAEYAKHRRHEED